MQHDVAEWNWGELPKTRKQSAWKWKDINAADIKDSTAIETNKDVAPKKNVWYFNYEFHELKSFLLAFNFSLFFLLLDLKLIFIFI